MSAMGEADWLREIVDGIDAIVASPGDANALIPAYKEAAKALLRPLLATIGRSPFLVELADLSEEFLRRW